MTDINEIKERFHQLHSDYNKQVKQIRDNTKAQAQSIIKDVFADFFVKQPKVYGIGWTQYTPYWSDGEECKFSVNDIKLFLSEDSYNDDDYQEGDQDLHRDRAFYAGRNGDQDEVDEIDAKIASFGGDEVYNAAVLDFANIVSVLRSIRKEHMEMLYGDHVSVLYTAEGVTVAEYDHE
ncbi:hypothetical protein G6L37_06565 [Agrobacterium rubi]|nr:hypothetical protein [Agrobacterium rubi]NTF25026.1 hypothetical protein [Agrobacterium rubi]